MSNTKKEVFVEIHNSTDHDGSAAIFLPDTKKIIALASERVSPRIKHDEDWKIAYEYLRKRLEKKGYIFKTEKDKFTTDFLLEQPIHHHLAHAASAFYPSGFKKSGVLVVDGFGLYKNGLRNSTTIWKGEETTLTPLFMNAEEDYQTQSLGHFYSSITHYLALGRLESGKTMGLASYGEKSEIYNWMKTYVHTNKNGTYYIHPLFLRSIRYLCGGAKMSEVSKPTPQMKKIMKDIVDALGPIRLKDTPITQRDKNLAWAAQAILEEIIIGLAKRTKELTGFDYLCMAGGSALNSTTNGKILQSGMFKDIFIQPASGDDGQALGKLLFRLHHDYGMKRFFKMETAYSGPIYTSKEIQASLKKYKDKISFEKLNTPSLLTKTASLLSSEKLVGWFQKNSEIGPRALGHRSILADPRPQWMRDHINKNIKHREWFRPLAPSVLLEKTKEYFALNKKSPFMLIVSKVKKGKLKIIPAVTHIDETARVQTVTKKLNDIYYDLIKEFENQTGIPLILNTSFNNAGEPIVETPEDAIKAFLNMELDALVIDKYLIKKRITYQK